MLINTDIIVETPGVELRCLDRWQVTTMVSRNDQPQAARSNRVLAQLQRKSSVVPSRLPALPSPIACRFTMHARCQPMVPNPKIKITGGLTAVEAFSTHEVQELAHMMGLHHDGRDVHFVRLLSAYSACCILSRTASRKWQQLGQHPAA